MNSESTNAFGKCFRNNTKRFSSGLDRSFVAVERAHFWKEVADPRNSAR